MGKSGSIDRKTVRRGLFWLAIAAVLLFGASQIMALPTSPTANRRSPAIISEFVADNFSGALVDEDGDRSDWIEITNRSDKVVDLAGWTLTDDPSLPNRWIFDQISLAPGEHLIVFASGKDRRHIGTDEETGQAGYLHTNFRLDARGGFLALYPPTSRRFLDGTAIYYPIQERDSSFGYFGDPTNARLTYGYFEQPSPGARNPDNPTQFGLTTPVIFSHGRGYYDEPFQLTLSTSMSDATIRYTLDGSQPSETNGHKYGAAIPIDSTQVVRAAAFAPGYESAPSAAHSYIFVDDVLVQGDNPIGFPTTWGTHEIEFGGHSAGDTVIADYAMDPAITKDPVLGPMLPQALHSLPVLSIATGVENWDIYTNSHERGRAAERPASMELFYPDGSEEDVQVNAGLRIQGGAGRWRFMPKHSFRLFFRREYGAESLEHQVFADSPAASFETLVLRAGVDRSFAGHPAAPGETVDHRLTTYIRDEWVRDSQILMSGEGSHGMFAHLYLDGLYWGLYNIIERPDTAFAATYFGGAEDEWHAVNHGGPVKGQTDRFDVLLRLAEEGGLTDPDKYATILEFIDPMQFSDYLILNWYAGNRDWPENNWYATVQYPAGKNYFFVWDAEDTWNEGAEINLGSDGFAGAPFPNVAKLVFEALWENPEFRILFADRMALHLSANGALDDMATQARWRELSAEIESAIVAESARWGDVRYDNPITPDDWRQATEQVLEQMEGNGARLLTLAKEAGYYPELDRPRFSWEEPEFEDDLTLEMTSTGGEIYFTTDGSDPRLPGGALAPGATRYTRPLELLTAIDIRARVLEGETWSALNRVFFRRTDQGGDVRLTEVMYNPPGGEAYEYVELQNLGEVSVDLSGAFFEGIDFRFPRGTVIEPNAIMTLISDFKRFRQRYPDPDIHGIFQGKLSDRGETIALYAADGTLISQVTYDDAGAWALSADGGGDSLVLADKEGDPDDAHSWRPSNDLYGSPGSSEEKKW